MRGCEEPAKLSIASSAPALPFPSGFANLNALPPGALRLRLRSARVFAPSLIPYASEEQDLGCAPVTRSHATGTVRGPELDDVAHVAPRELVDRCDRRQCQRAKVNKWSKGRRLRFTLTGATAPHCKFGVRLANPRAILLVSQALSSRCVTPGDKGAVAQFVADFAVRQRQSGRIENAAAGRAQNRVARRRVPFHRWREPRVDIAKALCDEAKFQRRTRKARLSDRQPFEKGIRLRNRDASGWQKRPGLLARCGS